MKLPSLADWLFSWRTYRLLGTVLGAVAAVAMVPVHARRLYRGDHWVSERGHVRGRLTTALARTEKIAHGYDGGGAIGPGGGGQCGVAPLRFRLGLPAECMAERRRW